MDKYSESGGSRPASDRDGGNGLNDRFVFKQPADLHNHQSESLVGVNGSGVATYT